MKKFFKPIFLLTLIVFLAIAVWLPVKSHSAQTVIHLPGIENVGPYGEECRCPAIVYYTCGCAIVFLD